LKHVTGGFALVGFMAAGKSSLGPPLSHALGLGFVDLDQVIVRDAGLEISEIFALHGERHFRSVEARVLRQVLALGPVVLACGGGVLDSRGSLQALKSWGRVVFVDVDLQTSMGRMGADPTRPLSTDPELAARFARRQGDYQNADLRVDGTQDLGSLVRIILEHPWN
jgi:shikimate kinase